MAAPRIETFQERYLHDFIVLNRQWIETHFAIEPMDLEQLENPHASILAPGGEILFLIEGERVVGTVALVPHGPGCFEVAKMAVAVDARGKGYGDQLMQAATEWAKNHGASRLMLLSNTVLEPAIALYQKHGFKTNRLGDHPDYKRCNIEMEKSLTG